MRKIKIILVLISLIIFSKSYAQNYFNKLDSAAFGHLEVIQEDTNYFVTGAVFNPSGSGSIVLSKYTLDGSLVLADTFTNDGLISMNGRIEAINNSLYLFNINNQIIPYDGTNNDLQFTKLNRNFVSEFSIPLGGPDEDVAMSILAYNNYLYLLTSTNSFGAGSADIYLVKADTNGNIIWENTYGSPQYDIAYSITPTHDGELLMTGSKRISGSDWDIYLVKIDTAGNLLWEKNYGSPWNDFFGGSSPSSDQSYFVHRNEHNDSQNSTSGFIEKLDGMGNVIWSKEFTQNNYSVFEYTLPIENEDGTIMVVNKLRNSNGKAIVKWYKLDPFGNILWSKEYFINPNISQLIYDIQPTLDGGYIMCGSAFPINSNKQHAWLVKTNCNGEEGMQYPITNTPCDQYDCTQYPIDASFTASDLTTDLSNGGDITFENPSSNTTSRVWNFGNGNKAYTDSLVSHTFTQEGIYDVQLIVFHAKCSDTFSLQIEVTNTLNVSTLALLNQKVNVFPNPNNGNFTLQNNTKEPIDMTIYDGMGKVIHRQKAEKVRSHINLNVNKGVYFMRILQNGTSVIKKIVVK